MPGSPLFDAIIIGLGGMGAAVASHLSRRGARVLGLEQFNFGHALGSSHGRTRIIRTAYYEHPDYIPLVQRSFHHWNELEQRANRSLLIPCDCVTIGPELGELVQGVRRAKDALPSGAVGTLAADELHARFGLNVPANYRGEIESAAGILRVEDCVSAHLDDARRHGAELREREPVRGWSDDGTHVTVHTDTATYTAAKLVITAGPWAGEVLADLHAPLTVMRQVMAWFTPLVPTAPAQFPVFLLDSPKGAYYGVPAIDSHGVKIARHYAAPELASPREIIREINDDDIHHIVKFNREYWPGRFGECLAAQVCIYTLTPDRHFIIDWHPRCENVAIAAGFSGHGFKFAPVVGEILADMVERGATRLPVDLFRWARLSPFLKQ